MKALILTFQFAHNYGAVWQAYSLKNYLSSLGADSTTVNYVPEEFARAYALINWKKRRSLKGYVRTARTAARRFDQYRKLTRFIEQELCNGKPFGDKETLSKLCSQADSVFCGSDQIWNDTITNKNGAYFLEGIDTGAKRISYAASFGKKDLTEFQKKMISDSLPGFNAVSLREEDGADEVRALTGIEPRIVMDPVFLTDVSTWRKLSEKTEIRESQPFILYYSLKKDPELGKSATALAAAAGAKLIAVHPTTVNPKVGTMYRNVGPYEFLYLLKNAEIVCTDSFHATAFSVIFGKKYFHIKNSSAENRVESLLNRVCAYDRCVQESNGYPVLDLSMIERNNLDKHIASSKEFIRTAIGMEPDPETKPVKHSIASIDISDCTGCEACAGICPVHAIAMETDSKGFVYPRVDAAQCITCGKCLTVCQAEGLSDVPAGADEFYAAKNKDTKERQTSKSGGFFIRAAQHFAARNEVVYGAVLDSDRAVRHKRASTADEVNLFKGSKYAQSHIGSIYADIAADLQTGKKVLFSGTACQCQGLKLYLEQKRVPMDLLYTIDIVCHGVPNDQLLRSYLTYIEKKYKKRIKSFFFRDKRTNGWGKEDERIVFEDDSVLTGDMHGNLDYFFTVYRHELIRESCYNCKYSKPERSSDITIGDFWGLEKTAPEFIDKDGVSLVIVHTNKGRELFREISDSFELLSVNREDCLQPNLIRPSRKKKETERYWKAYQKHGFGGLIRLDTPTPLKKAKRKLRKLKKLIPL